MLDTIKRKIQSQLAHEIIAQRAKQDQDELHEHATLTFARMPLHDISHQSLKVAAPVTYSFEENSVTTYPLIDKEGQQQCRLVIAKPRNGGEPYLALSRMIRAERVRDVCIAEDYERLTQGDYPKHLYIREQAGVCQDWLHMRYERVVKKAACRVTRGNIVLRECDYSLYSAPKMHKALEVERDANGTIRLFATVFRPLHDIASMREGRASAQDIGAKFSTLATSLTRPVAAKDDAPPVAATTQPVTTQHFTSTPAATAVRSASALPDVANMQSIKPVPSVSVQKDNTQIYCNLRIASKLIDSALSDDRHVSDVIRKALGLRVVDADRVSFDVKLSDEDYRQLAHRFGVEADNIQAIHEYIVEELGYFTGEDV